MKSLIVLVFFLLMGISNTIGQTISPVIPKKVDTSKKYLFYLHGGDASGNLLMLRMNYRAYDSETNSWNIKWLEALSGTWLELGPQKLGGVNISDSSIVYKAEFKPGELHRIKFSNINEEHFTWSVDISTDKGQIWNESVMIIQANRFKAAKYK